MSTAKLLTTDSPERVAFWRSLLKIETRVAVSIAKRDMPVERLMNLAPGMILQFDKPCDAPLTIEIDNQPIAHCDVVKIGDKFGVKLTSVIDYPEEWVPLITVKSPIDARAS